MQLSDFYSFSNFLNSKKSVNANPSKISNADILFFFLVFVPIFIVDVYDWVFSTNLKAFGFILFPLQIITTIIFLISLIKKYTPHAVEIPVNFVVYGGIASKKEMALQQLIGSLLGALIVGLSYTALSVVGVFTLTLSPLSITSAGVLTGLSALFVIGFSVGVTESVTIAGALIPTYSSVIGKNKIAIVGMLIIMGFIISAFFQIVTVGIIIAFAGVLLWFSGIDNSVQIHPYLRFIFALLMFAPFFASLHSYANGFTGDNYGVLLSPFIWMVGACLIDLIFGNSIIISLSWHIANNMFYLVLTNSYWLGWAFIFTTIADFLIFIPILAKEKNFQPVIT